MRNVFSKKTNVIISYFLVFLCLVFVFQIVNGQTPLPPVEGKIRYGFEYKTIDEVKQLELEIGAKENDTFWIRMANKLTEESLMGSFSRLAGGLRSPFTYKSPNTKKFFDFVCKIQGTEMEKISQIYQLVTDAIPNYGTPGSGVLDQNKFPTFEEVLSDCKGICRDQANLLSTALKSKGIDSRVIQGQIKIPGDHMWVRVKTSDGKEFDLDPTWYKDYVELKVRSSDAKKVPPKKNIITPVSPTDTIFDISQLEEDIDIYYEDFSPENSCDNPLITEPVCGRWSAEKKIPEKARYTDLIESVKYCESLGDGYRLPTVEELLTYPGERFTDTRFDDYFTEQFLGHKNSVVYAETTCFNPGNYYYSGSDQYREDFPGGYIGLNAMTFPYPEEEDITLLYWNEVHSSFNKIYENKGYGLCGGMCDTVVRCIH